MFLASLNDWHQMLEEDRKKNRMVEALDLFGGICEMPWFASTSIFLFLNKSDLIEQALKKKKLGEIVDRGAVWTVPGVANICMH